MQLYSSFSFVRLLGLLGLTIVDRYLVTRESLELTLLIGRAPASTTITEPCIRTLAQEMWSLLSIFSVSTWLSHWEDRHTKRLFLSLAQ